MRITIYFNKIIAIAPSILKQIELIAKSVNGVLIFQLSSNETLFINDFVKLDSPKLCKAFHIDIKPPKSLFNLQYWALRSESMTDRIESSFKMCNTINKINDVLMDLTILFREGITFTIIKQITRANNEYHKMLFKHVTHYMSSFIQKKIAYNNLIDKQQKMVINSKNKYCGMVIWSFTTINKIKIIFDVIPLNIKALPDVENFI